MNITARMLQQKTIRAESLVFVQEKHKKETPKKKTGVCLSSVSTGRSQRKKETNTNKNGDNNGRLRRNRIKTVKRGNRGYIESSGDKSTKQRKMQADERSKHTLAFCGLKTTSTKNINSRSKPDNESRPPQT